MNRLRETIREAIDTVFDMDELHDELVKLIHDSIDYEDCAVIALENCDFDAMLHDFVVEQAE